MYQTAGRTNVYKRKIHIYISALRFTVVAKVGQPMIRFSDHLLLQLHLGEQIFQIYHS